MTAAALLQDLAGRGVVLTADAGKLRYRAPAGTLTPDLRRQLEAHKAALVALLTSGQQVGLFDAAPGLGPAVIQRETTSQAPGKGLEFAKPDHVAYAAWLRFCELDSQWARLAPVAEYETFEELEAATGAAYLAAVANPSDQDLARAYARLDDAWAAVLELPEVQP